MLTDDQFNTIMTRLRAIERKVSTIRRRREIAQSRENKRRHRSPIHRKALELLSNPEANGHVPLKELRTFLQLDFPQRSVYRYLQKIKQGQLRPSVYYDHDEVFYEDPASDT